MITRQSWVDQKDELALSRQCQLLNVTRSVIYDRSYALTTDRNFGFK